MERKKGIGILDKQIIQISNFKPCFEPWLHPNRFLRSLILISYETNGIEEIYNNWEVKREKGIGIRKFIRFIEISNFNLCFKPIYPFFRLLISYETNGIREICNNWEVERQKGIGIRKFIRFIEISNFKPCFEPWLPISNRFLRSLILISYETNEKYGIIEREKGIGIGKFIR